LNVHTVVHTKETKEGPYLNWALLKVAMIYMHMTQNAIKVVNLDSEQILFFTTFLNNIKYAVKMFSFMYGLLKYVPLNCRGP
jgi:hypothetical protein